LGFPDDLLPQLCRPGSALTEGAGTGDPSHARKAAVETLPPSGVKLCIQDQAFHLVILKGAQRWFGAYRTPPQRLSLVYDLAGQSFRPFPGEGLQGFLGGRQDFMVRVTGVRGVQGNVLLL